MVAVFLPFFPYWGRNETSDTGLLEFQEISTPLSVKPRQSFTGVVYALEHPLHRSPHDRTPGGKDDDTK